MQAGLDASLNSNFSGSNVAGPPAQLFAPVVSRVCTLVLEGGWSPFNAFMPTHMASVYSAPAVIPSAAVGHNPFDAIYGSIGVGASHGNIPVPALILTPQVGTSSFA
jgi:hypothetical protein